MPCSDICLYLTLLLGSKLTDKIGPRLTIVISLFLKICAYTLLYFTKNYYIVLVAMGILGSGGGLGHFAYLKNSWRYFPQNQGLVNGIILGGGGISSSLLTPLADLVIINPEKKNANENTSLYSEEIANRLPKFLLLLLITFIIMGAIALIITFPYEENNENEKKVKKDNTFHNAKLKNALLSSKNLIMINFCFCGFCK